MSNLPIDDSYNSDEDEDYVPPADAPPENENDAYLVDKSGDTNGIEAPTKSADELWSDLMKNTAPSTSKSAKENDAATANSTSIANEEPKIPATPTAVGNTTTTATQKRKWTPSAKTSGGGLDGVLSAIKRDKKLSVLDKSHKDWNSFVESKSLKDELDSHIRSQGSFLDKQDFLAKSDFQKFQKERDAREATRKPH